MLGLKKASVLTASFFLIPHPGVHISVALQWTSWGESDPLKPLCLFVFTALAFSQLISCSGLLCNHTDLLCCIRAGVSSRAGRGCSWAIPLHNAWTWSAVAPVPVACLFSVHTHLYTVYTASHGKFVLTEDMFEGMLGCLHRIGRVWRWEPNIQPYRRRC